MGVLSSCKLHPLCAISLIRNAGICLTFETWMPWRTPQIMSSSCSQTHDPGKAMGSKVMGAFGPSNIYCGLDLLGADVVMVDGQSTIPWGILYGRTSSYGQIRRDVGPAGSHMDVLAPLPSLNGLLQLRQWLIYLLGLS